MKKMFPLIAAVLLAGNAYAQTPAPKTASEKKLVGAALASFTKKCETDAETKCNTAATEKKLAGAAKTSFTKKCIADSVGE